MDLKRLLEIRKRKEEINRSLNDLKGEELDKVIKEVEDLEKEEDDLNKRAKLADDIEKRGKAIVTPVNDKVQVPEVVTYTADSNEYRSAYLKRLQGKALNDEEKRAFTTVEGSAGAVIPTQTMNKIIEKLEQYGVILPLVTPLAIPSNVTIPVEDVTNDYTWVDEGAESKDSDDKLTSVKLGAMELIKTVEITAHVEAMSIDAFEAFVVAQLSKKAKKAIDYAIINGDGKKNATGILPGATAINPAGETYDYDDLMEILKNLKSGYKQGAKFVMSTNTLYGEIAKIKDADKRPIFKMETDGRFEGKLSGYPVVVYDNVPDGTIIFGNFEYYYFNFVKAFEIAKDTSVGFKSAKTCYRALALCDGKPALKEAFVVMKKAEANASGAKKAVAQ